MRKWFIHLCALSLLGGFVSPAGAKVFLAHTRLDQGHWQVWLAEADGKNPRPLTSSAWDKRSLRSVPGKSEILLRDNQGQIYRLGISSPAREAKADLGFDVVKDFDFHPQAGWLVAAYAPNALDNVCIWHVPASAGAKRLLILDPYLNETPRWSDEGKSFIFAKAHAGKSWLCRSQLAEPKAQVFLTQNFVTASDPAWSPDGSRLVFCGRTEATVDLWLCSNQARDVRRVYGGSAIEAEPSWSLDGAWIYFATWQEKNFRLARIRPDGKDFGFVSPEGTDCRCPILVSDDIGGQHG